MSKVAFQLRYDGPALSEHGMDVADLAPALLALGDLIKRANANVNGDAKVNLIVQSDFEHKCFQVSLELVQIDLQHHKRVLNRRSQYQDSANHSNLAWPFRNNTSCRTRSF